MRENHISLKLSAKDILGYSLNFNIAPPPLSTIPLIPNNQVFKFSFSTDPFWNV